MQVAFARRRLRIPERFTASVQSLFVLDKNLDADLQTKLLLNLYCCYSARNALKRHVNPEANRNIHECMMQLAHQGTFGHRTSQRVLAPIGAEAFGNRRAQTAGTSRRGTFVSGGDLVTGAEWSSLP